MTRQYVTFSKNDPIQVATVERIGHEPTFGESGNGYYRGNPVDAEVGVYQVSYSDADTFAEDGFPSGGFQWGTLLVLASPWGGKTFLYFPNDMSKAGGFYVKSYWTEALESRTGKWFKVSATLMTE